MGGYTAQTDKVRRRVDAEDTACNMQMASFGEPAGCGLGPSWQGCWVNECAGEPDFPATACS